MPQPGVPQGEGPARAEPMAEQAIPVQPGERPRERDLADHEREGEGIQPRFNKGMRGSEADEIGAESGQSPPLVTQLDAARRPMRQLAAGQGDLLYLGVAGTREAQRQEPLGQPGSVLPAEPKGFLIR